MFDAVVNPYLGCYIGPEQLAVSTAEFSQRLRQSIDAWQHHYRLIWLELPASRAELVPQAIALGFDFHHCQPQQLMLVKKLQPDAYLPLAATHSVGVGAVVLSDNGKVLLVQEQPLAGRALNYFKLPGGMVDPKEHLQHAVLREVQEETGILARFDAVLGFRHHHQGQFGASNLYMVCRLLAPEQPVQPDAREILQARWFGVEDYLADVNASPYNKLLVKSAVQTAGLFSQQVTGYMQGPDQYEIFSGLAAQPDLAVAN